MKQVKSLNEPFIHSFHPSIHSEICSKTLIHPVIKQVMSLNDSFIHLICLKTMIHPVMKQVMSLNESLNHSRATHFSAYNLILPCQTWVK